MRVIVSEKNKELVLKIKDKIERYINANIDAILSDIARDMAEQWGKGERLWTPEEVAAKLVDLDFDIWGEIPQTWAPEDLEPFAYRVSDHTLYIYLKLPSTHTVRLKTSYWGEPIRVKKEYIEIFNAIRTEISARLVKYLKEQAESQIKELTEKLRALDRELDKLKDENKVLRSQLQDYEKLREKLEAIKRIVVKEKETEKEEEEEEEEDEEDP